MSLDGAQIITFYSYKGGTGRTMHLANVAWILASNGQRVLVVDWDLEAPGLHRYFRPFLVDKDLAATDGLIDLIWDFAEAAMTPVSEAERARGWHDEYADLLRCTAAVRWRWPTPGRLDLLPAGRQGPDYSRRVNSFNWQNFYDRLGGGVFLESVKDWMRKEYDYVLIDSRTGVSDTAGICTVQMPDALVLCFTANNQSIEGCASIARSVREQWGANAQRRPDRYRILPLLTRVDGSEKDKLNGRRNLARSRFDPYVASLSAAGSIDDYWRDTEVPYVPWYSYEEVVAAFADKYKEKISILDSAEALTRVLTRGEITSLVRPSEEERARVLVEFAAGGDAVPDASSNHVPRVVASSPYPGLRPFTSADAAMFFGRNDEIGELVARLRERELYVIGPSGSGKTSLVCAGLIPLLERSPERVEARFLIRLLRPGTTPFSALSAVFEADSTLEIARLGSAVGSLLERHPECDRVLIVIDQLEELFTMADGVERARFIDAIHALRAEPRIVMLSVLRADFYGVLLESRLSEGLAGRIARVQVGPLRGDMLREAITGPARAIGLRVEPALVECLVADVNDQPGALPLLQMALAQLWSRCQGDVITAAHYTELGRLRVLADHADFVCRMMVRVEETTALRILLRLVNFGEGRAGTRRQQPRAALLSAGASVGSFDIVLRQLVDGHLVTVTGDEMDGEVLIDLAHEALIQVWSRFAEWIQTWRVHEQRRRELESVATAWRVSGRGERGLLEGNGLAVALGWRAEARHLGQSADLAALLGSSEAVYFRWTRRQRRLSQVLVAGVALFAVLAGTLSLQAVRRDDSPTEQRIKNDHRLAHALQLQSYQETGRQLLLDDQHPLQALPYLVAARAAKTDGEPGSPLRMLFAQAARYLPIAALEHQGIVSSAAFSPDGTRIVTTGKDNTARVWDGTTGEPLSRPLMHQGVVWSAKFSPDGARVVTASEDHTARVWDAVTGKPISLQLAHRDVVWSAAFSPDGARIVTASSDGTARVWGAITGTRCRRRSCITAS
jgi:MinD-like ATPase involved in chromosome partitioning or flagellar assembly